MVATAFEFGLTRRQLGFLQIADSGKLNEGASVSWDRYEGGVPENSEVIFRPNVIKFGFGGESDSGG